MSEIVLALLLFCLIFWLLIVIPVAMSVSLDRLRDKMSNPG